MFIVKYKNFFLAATLLLIALCLGLVWKEGLKLGIDFTGGTVLEASYAGVRPDTEAVRAAVEKAGVEGSLIQETGTSGVIVKMRAITEEEHAAVSAALLALSPASYSETQFNLVGPVIGSELRDKSIKAITLVIVLIVLYIAFAFRKVSRPVKSWKYGLIAVVTLLHDVALPLGFVVFMGLEVDVLFVTAILAVLGFSIHDTIVVFDRIRENLRGAGKKETFEETVGKSLSQTFARSINTSLTVVLVLLVLYFVGSAATHNFTLTLIVGIIAGTYSSIFFASTLLIQLYNWQKDK